MSAHALDSHRHQDTHLLWFGYCAEYIGRVFERSVRLALTVEGSIFAPDQQRRLIDAARLADEAGVDNLTIPEHILMGSHASEQDPGVPGTPIIWTCPGQSRC